MKQKTSEILVYLAGCALNGITPKKERLEGLDYKELYNLSTQQSLQALIFIALEDAFLGKIPDNDTFKRWQERYEAALVRSKMVGQQMSQIVSFLETSGIWHMPLKGAILESMYPSKVMRQMTDRDILYDVGAKERVRMWFTSHGYKAEIFNLGVVDVYTKKPFYSFEMHSSLFGYSPGTIWHEYYQNIKERLILDNEKKFSYHFSDEDFYIHLIIHGCKHYFNEGNGLRLLIDIYVYLKKKNSFLDWKYINQELKTLEVVDFEEKARKLSCQLFSNQKGFCFESLTIDEETFLNTFIENGVYGNVDNLVRNKISTPSVLGKIKYLWQRGFPKAEFFKYNYPFFYHHKWLLPFGYIYRIAYRLKVNRSHLTREILAICKL